GPINFFKIRFGSRISGFSNEKGKYDSEFKVDN
ncbi:uncharacterized protein METZ01_LOCUS278260, partial [marine metagenome]